MHSRIRDLLCTSNTDLDGRTGGRLRPCTTIGGLQDLGYLPATLPSLSDSGITTVHATPLGGGGVSELDHTVPDLDRSPNELSSQPP